ncbi:DUF4183 domain-containing protein [Heyndrickxia vini]|uniref:DUF4183 domain-containing protein n=1 Tax=Heyndrickxia vini TaxID=1476025 RepID=A0ABX7E401_9BACI|nr:DUF4183 domain-containing protein [Heyndrickxia vini]QQZ10025.1 DUF4183 domain-containing protein [Heyndrickxia vini]
MAPKNNKIPGPSLQFPIIYQETIRVKLPQSTDIKTFYTYSDGKKRVYYDRDGAEEGSQILDPNTVSFVNVFINAVLQPIQNFKISQGEFQILTSELPIKGVPIILQFITIY